MAQTSAQLSLSVQKIGNYSYLTLEGLGLFGKQSSAAPGFPPPPLTTPMQGAAPSGSATSKSLQEQANLLATPVWRNWFQQLWTRVNVTVPLGVSAIIEAPSIDETDVDWYAMLTGPVGTSDPLTFQPNFSPFQSRYGRKFAVGDYVLFNDFSSYIGTDGVPSYGFEIAQITAISGGVWTLTRSNANTTPPSFVPSSGFSTACFGTPLIPHTPPSGGFIAIYRLIDKFWSVAVPQINTPQVVKLPWDNMCVVAVLATVPGVTPVLLPLTAALPGPAIPGFRTLSGAEYTLGAPGAVALGTTSILRLSVAGWHSIRNVFFEMDGAAPNGATAIALAYIRPDRQAAYLLGKYVIPTNARVGYAVGQSNVTFPVIQQNTRFPAQATWPPHANLPLMVNGLDGNGVLKNGFTLDPTQPMTMQEDGELDFIVTANPSTPGTGLRGTVQT